MKYTKQVDLESLSEEEKNALDSGEKTEEDLISEWEAEEKKQHEEELLKAKEIADNYKIRAEKAEQEAKAAKKAEESKETPKNDLPQSDLIALIRAEIADEDIDDIKDYAALKKISVAEALKSSVIKSLLAERKEERVTAEATATGNKRGGVKAPSGDELLARAREGKMPTSDSEIEKLVDARFQSKVRK